jgi:hypothetical protein
MLVVASSVSVYARTALSATVFHVKLHRFGVRVNLDDTHFGAFFVRVLVERKQSGFALPNELHEPGHPLALVVEFPFLEPVRRNEDERS